MNQQECNQVLLNMNQIFFQDFRDFNRFEAKTILLGQAFEELSARRLQRRNRT